MCALFFALVVTLSILLVPRTEDIDSGSYRLMAAGERACRPYANRILHPLLARVLSHCDSPFDWDRRHLGGADWDRRHLGGAMNRPTAAETAAPPVNSQFPILNSQFSILNSPFTLLALLSSITFYLCVLSLLRDIRPRWWTFPLLISPLWWVWGGNIYIQDMFAAALTALLFIALRGNARMRVVLAFILLFLLQLTRESTAVLAIALTALALWRRDWRLALSSLFAMALGMVVVSWATRDALPNTNELGGFAYLACKTLANGLRNLTGVIPWNDGYAVHLPWHYPNPPLWKCTLPAFLQMGNVHEVGVYAIEFKTVLRTLALWLLYFPGALLFFALRRRAHLECVTTDRNTSLRARVSSALACLRAAPLYVQHALVVGLLFWILAPFSGTSLDRLVGYSWPLFWVAIPWRFRAVR